MLSPRTITPDEIRKMREEVAALELERAHLVFQIMALRKTKELTEKENENE